MRWIGLVLSLILCIPQVLGIETGKMQRKVVADSVNVHKLPSYEYGRVYKIKKVSSPFPVEIKVKGRNLYVVSKQDQMLPIYKGTGVFYGLFKLNKGTNWISGLPKGNYIINNKVITVS